VNLVAGTLNAYSLASTEAESVAAKFFGMVQIGRVRGEELASVLGRVTAVSAELGVSLDELGAMFVALTVSGVKPAEAATALRAGMMALIKPSQDLQKELRAVGFESGAQMIAAYGLEGTFLKLRASTDDNIATFAKLIPNVRAISGALRETQDGGQKTADALKHLHETTVAAFNARYKLFIDSDAQKTLAEMNKLHVFLTTDLGTSLVATVSKTLGVVGGMDTLTAGIKAMIPIVGAAVVAFGGYGLALGAVALNARLAAASLGTARFAVSGLMAAVTAYAAYDFTNTKIDQIFDKLRAEFHKTSEDSIAAAAAAATARLEAEDRVTAGIVQRVAQDIAEQTKGYFAAVDAAKTANAVLVADSHATMEKIAAGAEKQVHILRDEARQGDGGQLVGHAVPFPGVARPDLGL
jgi:TP901 family phage tail tape measure protein